MTGPRLDGVCLTMPTEGGIPFVTTGPTVLTSESLFDPPGNGLGPILGQPDVFPA